MELRVFLVWIPSQTVFPSDLLEPQINQTKPLINERMTSWKLKDTLLNHSFLHLLPLSSLPFSVCSSFAVTHQQKVKVLQTWVVRPPSPRNSMPSTQRCDFSLHLSFFSPQLHLGHDHVECYQVSINWVAFFFIFLLS